MRTFGARLHHEILKHGYTVSEFAHQAGYDRSTLYAVITDKSGAHSTSLARMLQVLPNTDARWLICGKEQ